MAHISKSAFVRGIQCPKQLYYYKNSYNKRDALTESQRVSFKRGTDVGLLAQQLFPGGRDLTPASPWQYKQSANITRHYIEQEAAVLYEASFLYDSLYAIMDIVVNTSGSLKLYEVKNTRSVKEQHVLDASFQYYVITQAGFKVESIAIVYPIESPDDYDSTKPLSDLFKIEDITALVQERQSEIEKSSQYQVNMLLEPLPPETTIGNQCFKPYACDFMGLCWAGTPPNAINTIIGIDDDKRRILTEKQLLPR
ncbi:MAG: CRISPR-associated protein Cas4 [Sphingobacteriales bacterium JAD_PAG50586_3]|nr:MAG: CRISPR-associated protein Cas4 [Sphingobacteriales bacterium JAD_PAG50586_3]